MVDACRTILECLGEDIEREGLVKTPTRMAEALLFMTEGYEKSLAGCQDSKKDNPTNLPRSCE